MAKDEDGDDLMAQGLIGMSYDSVFAIRKRVRKFGDFTIPLRGGLTYAQLGTGLITLVVMFFVYAIVVTPTVHREGPMRHDWIVWEPAEEFSEEFSTDLLLTRESIERRFTGTVTDLASAQQSVSRQHLADERARAERDAVSEKDDYELRHTDASGVTGL